MAPARSPRSQPIAAFLVSLLVVPLSGCGEDPQRLAGTIHLSKKLPGDRLKNLPPKAKSKLPKSMQPTTDPVPPAPRP